MKQAYSIGIDIGGTKTAIGLFDSNGYLLERVQYPSDKDAEPDVFFEKVAEQCKKLLAVKGIGLDDIDGIGIGVPSFVLFEQGRIIKTSNLTKIKDFPARDYFASCFDKPVRIVIDNDAHTGALAELRHGAGKGFEHMLFCPVSTGISSGIIINKQLFRGSYGWAGESGHMLTSPDTGISCGCGNRGCLMSWCSGSMIVKHVEQKIAAGEKTLISTLAAADEAISTVHISEAWEQNDIIAKQAVEQMAQYMAIWLYNLYVTLNINCFVFSGGLLCMGDKLFKRVRELFDSYNDNEYPVYFKTALCGQDAGIIGARELLY